MSKPQPLLLYSGFTISHSLPPDQSYVRVHLTIPRMFSQYLVTRTSSFFTREFLVFFCSAKLASLLTWDDHGRLCWRGTGGKVLKRRRSRHAEMDENHKEDNISLPGRFFLREKAHRLHYEEVQNRTQSSLMKVRYFAVMLANDTWRYLFVNQILLDVFSEVAFLRESSIPRDSKVQVREICVSAQFVGERLCENIIFFKTGS